MKCGLTGAAGLLLLGCGARHAPPVPVPGVRLEVGVEQAIMAESELLLVGITIGTQSPDGVIVDQVDASASLQGTDLGELELVPMMEARMPPWTLMLMWRIPESFEPDRELESSIAGTVTWRGTGKQTRRTAFEIPIEVAGAAPTLSEESTSEEESPGTPSPSDSAAEDSP